MLSFQLPLELMLLANLALSFVLVLPLPLSKPGVALCKFSTTKVGQGITTAAFAILLLLMIQPLYDMKNLHMQVSDISSIDFGDLGFGVPHCEISVYFEHAYSHTIRIEIGESGPCICRPSAWG